MSTLTLQLGGVIAERDDLVRLHALASSPGRGKRLLAERRLRVRDRLLMDPLLEGVVKPSSELLTERRRLSEELRAALMLVLGDEDRPALLTELMQQPRRSLDSVKSNVTVPLGSSDRAIQETVALRSGDVKTPCGGVEATSPIDLTGSPPPRGWLLIRA